METVLQSKKHPKIVVKSAFERLQKVLLTDYRVICIKKVVVERQAKNLWVIVPDTIFLTKLVSL